VGIVFEKRKNMTWFKIIDWKYVKKAKSGKSNIILLTNTCKNDFYLDYEI